MKKVVSFILFVCLICSFSLQSFAQVMTAEDCALDSEGNLVAYLGEYEDVLTIPFQINDRPVKTLITQLFYGKPLGSVYLENGIEKIEDGCFWNSTIDYIDIPASVTTVGEDAFRDCKNLTSMAIASDETKFGKDALNGTGYLHIAVPCSEDLITLHDAIAEAKGDENFTFDVMHIALVESMEEKDHYGNPVYYCEECGYSSKEESEHSIPFTDVSADSWYFEYVAIAYDFGIIKGKSQNIFDPNANMTLAEAAKIAASIEASHKDDAPQFLEKKGETWYQPYVDYCYETGLIEPQVSFDWSKPATRAEMAYLFSRADDGLYDWVYEPNYDVPLSDIPDVDERTPFAHEILSLYRRGIARGSNEYYAYYPDANVKRSEVAALIARILCYDLRIDLPKG